MSPKHLAQEESRFGAQRVLVVSIMGLEDSGLQIAAERYVAAAASQGLRATLVSSELATDQIDDLVGGSLEYIRTHSRKGDVIFWVGLHTRDEFLRLQITAMEEASSRGVRNIVVPERTEREDDLVCCGFVDAVPTLVNALISFNDLTKSQWVPIIPKVPHVVIPPPVPSSFFEVYGNAYRGFRSRPKTEVLFMGRISERKGISRLIECWDGSSLASAFDSEPGSRLTFLGRSYRADQAEEAIRSILETGRRDVRWVDSFDSRDRLEILGTSHIGISLSHQEFDAIALSEMMAAGVPVIASDTTGHIALAKSNSGVVIVSSIQEARGVLEDLSASPIRIRELGASAHRSMYRTRSIRVVGPRLKNALLASNSDHC